MEADLTDIPDNLIDKATFREALLIIPEIDAKEIAAILAKRKNNSALGYDDIPYSFLKALGPAFTAYIAEVTTAC